jgi:hypothetical protein
MPVRSLRGEFDASRVVACWKVDNLPLRCRNVRAKAPTSTLRALVAVRSLSAMSRSKGLPPLIQGCATAEGTERFRRRFSDGREDHFYRLLADGPVVSSLGLGTYLGECDDDEDARYVATVIAAVERGVNLLDTAIN